MEGPSEVVEGRRAWRELGEVCVPVGYEEAEDEEVVM